MDVLFWLGMAILAGYGVAACDVYFGNRAVRPLRETSADLRGEAPRVSIIIAARNESRCLARSLQSLLELDYPDYELIVVDDRSQDDTGAILDTLASLNPHLRVIHIGDLPAGWLGKNHALWVGSRRATGDLLLFSDADIIMEPTVLRRAVNFMAANRLEQLAVTPSLRVPGRLLDLLATTFTLAVSLVIRPWKAGDPASRCHAGSGAFNLLRSRAYRQVGGHGAIRLRPDDHLKLGKIVKQAGLAQNMAYAPDLLAVEWYHSLPDLVGGVEKSLFSVADYRVGRVLLGAFLLLLAGVWPYLALLVTQGATRLPYVAAVALITLLYLDSARRHGGRYRYAAGLPLGAFLLAWILVRSMVVNLRRGGICWRGTFYPLEQLKGNRV